MKFYYKMRQILLKNKTAILLQNAAVLLQNATVIANCENFITKCDSYYKMQCLLQIATVHSVKVYYLQVCCKCIRL